MAKDERSEAEKRWIDRLLNPLEGPASENAYPEDMMIEIDGKEVPMNSAARAFNRMFGYVDEAADIPWTPEKAKSPEGVRTGWTDEQLAEHAALRAKFDADEKRYEESTLKSASELPDLDGDELEITWDLEERGEGEDDQTILLHGDRVIWREIGLREALPRFDEVIWILREKYGPRLVSLTPTRAGLLQIRGRGYSAKTRIDGLNEELRDKREPLSSEWSIEVDDANPDKPEAERQEEQLTASIEKMGVIDCSCGWAGRAAKARISGHGNSREINCPECRRPLYRIWTEA